MTKSACSILHTSDIHLDNDIGYNGSESPAQLGLTAVIDAALSLDVDLFLLAGDLFDHNRVKEPCLEFATQQLSRLHCPVAMICGNHDCLADYSIYHKYDPTLAEADIRFIREEEGADLHFPELGLKIWGKGIVDHHPGNQPLENMPTEPFEGWHIGMVHGFYVGGEAERFSSLITPEEIEQSHFDYLALGHVHVFSTMEHGGTTAAYSGSPNVGQGVRERTAAHVLLHPEEGVSVRRLLV